MLISGGKVYVAADDPIESIYKGESVFSTGKMTDSEDAPVDFDREYEIYHKLKKAGIKLDAFEKFIRTCWWDGNRVYGGDCVYADKYERQNRARLYLEATEAWKEKRRKQWNVD